MGAMKRIFTDIQEQLERGDWKQLVEILDNLPGDCRAEPEDCKAQWLLDTVRTLATWQEKGQN